MKKFEEISQTKITKSIIMDSNNSFRLVGVGVGKNGELKYVDDDFIIMYNDKVHLKTKYFIVFKTRLNELLKGHKLKIYIETK